MSNHPSSFILTRVQFIFLIFAPRIHTLLNILAKTSTHPCFLFLGLVYTFSLSRESEKVIWDVWGLVKDGQGGIRKLKGRLDQAELTDRIDGSLVEGTQYELMLPEPAALLAIFQVDPSKLLIVKV